MSSANTDPLHTTNGCFGCYAASLPDPSVRFVSRSEDLNLGRPDLFRHTPVWHLDRTARDANWGRACHFWLAVPRTRSSALLSSSCDRCRTALACNPCAAVDAAPRSTRCTASRTSCLSVGFGNLGPRITDTASAAIGACGLGTLLSMSAIGNLAVTRKLQLGCSTFDKTPVKPPLRHECNTQAILERGSGATKIVMTTRSWPAITEWSRLLFRVTPTRSRPSTEPVHPHLEGSAVRRPPTLPGATMTSLPTRESAAEVSAEPYGKRQRNVPARTCGTVGLTSEIWPVDSRRPQVEHGTTPNRARLLATAVSFETIITAMTPLAPDVPGVGPDQTARKQVRPWLTSWTPIHLQGFEPHGSPYVQSQMLL